MKVCCSCKEPKIDSDFSFKNKASGKLAADCKLCHSQYNKAHYGKRKSYYVAKAKSFRAKWDTAVYMEMQEFFSKHPCVDCGEDNPVILQFDHVIGDKVTCVGNMQGWSKERRDAEIKKCEVRCANCHWIVTALRANWGWVKVLGSARVAQSIARCLPKAQVAGWSPAMGTKFGDISQG